MTSYRPITDVWILGRPKSHYYGAFPEGFLWRAKVFLPGKCLHLCSGLLKPYFPIDQRAILGDETVDLDPSVHPTYVVDATNTGLPSESYDAVLVDPPYTVEDAKKYKPQALPDKHLLLKEAERLVKVGGRIGFLDYLVPRPPKNLRFVAAIGVFCGFDNRMRCFSVFVKTD